MCISGNIVPVLLMQYYGRICEYESAIINIQVSALSIPIVMVARRGIARSLVVLSFLWRVTGIIGLEFGWALPLCTAVRHPLAPCQDTAVNTLTSWRQNCCMCPRYPSMLHNSMSCCVVPLPFLCSGQPGAGLPQSSSSSPTPSPPT